MAKGCLHGSVALVVTVNTIWYITPGLARPAWFMQREDILNLVLMQGCVHTGALQVEEIIQQDPAEIGP